MASAPNRRFSATKVRAKELNGCAGLSKATSNGEVEGRPEAPIKRRGRTLSPRARGAYPPTVHGPLQRLLGGCADSA